MQKKVSKEFIEEHILYEFQMLLVAYNIDVKNQIDQNIKIDLFCLHARNLMEFFYIETSGNSEYEYARAYDAVEYSDSWKAKYTKQSRLFNKYYGRICSYSAHLSLIRSNEEKIIEKDIKEIKRELIKVLIIFIDCLPENSKKSVKEIFKSIICINDDNKKTADSSGSGVDIMPIDGVGHNTQKVLLFLTVLK